MAQPSRLKQLWKAAGAHKLLYLKRSQPAMTEKNASTCSRVVKKTTIRMLKRRLNTAKNTADKDFLHNGSEQHGTCQRNQGADTEMGERFVELDI